MAKLRSQHSAEGVSLKTQVLFAVALSARLLVALPTGALGESSALGALALLLCQWATAAAVWWHGRTIRTADSLPAVPWLLGLCCALGAVSARPGTPSNVAGAASVYLEAVAVAPQLEMMAREEYVLDSLMALCVLSLVVSKGLFVLSWLSVPDYVGHCALHGA
eukprot:m51a1_g5880 putative er lumen protein retaining receptor (164) ;mRNA; r:509409-510040